MIVSRFSLSRIRLTAELVGACLMLAVSTVACATQPPTGATAPPELTRLVHLAAAAASEHDPARMRPLAAQGAEGAFDWTRSTTTANWSGDVLHLPSSGAGSSHYLAVFHAWHTCESDGDHVHRLLDAPSGWKLGPEIPEDDALGIQVTDHDLNVRFDVPHKRAIITDTAHVRRSNRVHPFALLRLSQDYQVESLALRANDADTPLPFSQAGGIVAFTSPQADSFTLRMAYSGGVNHRGSDYILPTEATLDSYWYPQAARLPATSTVTVTAPAGWTPLAQGELKSSVSNGDGGVTDVFRNDVPNCYYTVDAAPYHISTRKAGAVTLYAYLLSTDQKFAETCLDRLQSALEFYSSHFSPFPYTRYTVVQTRGPFAGALEAYSFATFGPGALPGSIPHELSHTWWGGVVPNTYLHSMWNESFADYSDDLWNRSPGVEVTAIPPDVHRLPTAVYAAYPVDRAWDTSDGAQNSAGYGKGAQVLRVLEDELGQTTMVRCIRGFVGTHHRGDAAEWSDFERAVHATTGKAYDWFFSEWLTRTGAPQLRLANVSASADGADSVISGAIVQSGQPYRITLPIYVVSQTGDTVSQRVTAEGASTPFSFHVHGTPARVIVDPYRTVPIALPPGTPGDSDPDNFTFPTAGARLQLVQPAAVVARAHAVLQDAPPARNHSRAACSPLSKSTVRRCAYITLRKEARTLYLSSARRSRRPSCRAPLAPLAPLAPQTPAALDGFLSGLAAAANSGDERRFRTFVEPGTTDDATWVSSQSALPATDPAAAFRWRAYAIQIPAGGGAPRFAVLSRYHPCESQGDHIYTLVMTGGAWKLGHEYEERDPIGTRIRSHDARITLDPASGWLHAVDVMRMEPNNPSTALPSPNLLFLRLEDGYHVSAVRRAGRPLRFSQAGGVVAVRSDVDLARLGAAASLEIAYAGRAGQTLEDFITPAEAALSGYWLPEIGRLPVTYRIAVTVPAGWTAFTQGVAAGRSSSPNGRTITYRYNNSLAVSFPSLDAGPYHLYMAPRTADPFRIQVAYLRKGDGPLARKAADTAHAALHFYSTHFSPFPYPQYTVVISDHYAEALEGYSMVTITRGFVPNVLPHEISHTWWGGVQPNTYLHDLWNESMAEYSDGLYERDTGRSDGAHEQEIAGMKALNLLASTPGLTLRTAHDALDVRQSLVGYFKGSLVLEGLEQMMGQAKMIACIRAFAAARVPGDDATWTDLEDAILHTAGAEWKGFFDGWLSSDALPALQWGNVQVTESGGIRAVQAELKQQGGTDMWMSVPVRLSLRGGGVVNTSVSMRAPADPVRIALPAGAEPATLEADPDQIDLRLSSAAALPPTLVELLARDAPLLVVYGTGGTAEENAAMKEAAGKVAGVFSFAKVNVVSDRDFSRDVSPTGSMLVIGRPDESRFATMMAGLFPVGFGAGPSIKVGDHTSADPDVWVFSAITAPSQMGSARAAMLFAGNSPAATRQIDSLRSLPGAESTYLARGAADVIASLAPVSAKSTVYEFK